MKKIISLLLALCMISSFILPAFASSAEDELDLTQYSLDDIANMSADEYRQLLSDFERVYDPFDTYNTDPLVKNNEEPGIEPYWTSGETDLSEIGSHEVITMRAFDIVTEDIGKLGQPNDFQMFFAYLSISLASLLPDKKENDALTFKGHFYNPKTGKNWMGGKDDTALTNCVSHFNKAVTAARTAYGLDDSTNMNIAYEEIGRALHYLQDASEPHHAANYTVPPYMSHKRFEEFVDADIDRYTASCTTANGKFSNATYALAKTKDVSYFVNLTANYAYNYKDMVNDTDDQSQWDYVATKTVEQSVVFSSIILYKFFYQSDIPLTRW